jgi:hypothetical protein
MLSSKSICKTPWLKSRSLSIDNIPSQPLAGGDTDAPAPRFLPSLKRGEEDDEEDDEEEEEDEEEDEEVTAGEGNVRLLCLSVSCFCC